MKDSKSMVRVRVLWMLSGITMLVVLGVFAQRSIAGVEPERMIAASVTEADAALESGDYADGCEAQPID